MLGDSLSAPSPLRATWPGFMPAISLTWAGSEVHNYAVSGQTSGDVVVNYFETAHQVRPKTTNDTAWLLVWVGFNDLATGKTAAEVYANLRLLWNLGRNDGFKVAAFTITRGGAFTEENGLFQEWQELNSLIIKEQLYDALCRPDMLFPSPMDPLYFLDGIHPTPLGAEVIAGWIASSMANYW